jgi:hypothetical protein
VPELPDAALERETVRLRCTPPPWSIEVDPAVPGRVPTLVVTGGWNDAYEDVAKALADSGARHVQLVGHGHRPQDHDQANALMREHWAEAESAETTPD